MAFGTTILSGKYDFGMLVAADSWSFKLDGTKWKTINSEGIEEDEVAKKIFHLGKDPPSYIIYAFSGHDYLGLHIHDTLTEMMEDNHKMGRVLTSKECARYAHTFLKMKIKWRPREDSTPTVNHASLSCGVTVATYAHHMQKRKLKLMKKKKSKKREEEDDEKEPKLKTGKNLEKRKREEDDEKKPKLKKRKKSKKREEEDDEKEPKLKTGKKLEKRKREEDDEKKLKLKKRKKSKKREEGDDEKEPKLKTGKKLENRKQDEDEDDEKKLKLRKRKKKKEKQTQFNHELYFASAKFKANRKAKLYYADKKQVHKIKRFFADGYGDKEAKVYLRDVYDPSDELNVAVTKMEDAMVTACAIGHSGGTITIDRIDCNNVIMTVSQKDINQLRRAKSIRDLVALSANRQGAPREDHPPPYNLWPDCGRSRPAV